jgi:hypothetical protein
LIRAELAGILGAHGIPVAGQAIFHLARAAALEGAIGFGPERDGELTYIALDENPPRARDPEPALAELARRYLAAYGPATPRDLAAWSGLTIGQARAGFEAISGDLLEVRIADAPAWLLKRQGEWLDARDGEPVARLLPRYDGYLLGYQSRDFLELGAYAKPLHPGGGMINPSVMADGRPVGVWRAERKPSRMSIVIQPFESLDSVIGAALEAEARDIGRYLRQATELRVEP